MFIEAWLFLGPFPGDLETDLLQSEGVHLVFVIVLVGV
jgi:hypothetical protein